MDTYKKKILEYYDSLESKLGYKHLLWKTKHFGYYPLRKADISERKAQELMQDLIYKNLKFSKKDVVLDAGCGYGMATIYLAKKYGAKFFGIDINPDEIKQAKECMLKENLISKVTFKVMDFSKSIFSSNTFDAIYTMETLSHAPDIKQTLKEFYRILKPRGKLALFEYTIAEDNQFSRREMELLNQGIEGTATFGIKQFRHNEFPAILKSVGFESVKEQNITENCKPSLERLRRFANIPYKIIQLFGLQNKFTNTLIAVEWSKLVDRDLLRYCIFTAQKP